LLIPVGLANFATLAGVGWALAFIRTLPFDLNAWDRLRERGLGVLQGSFWVFLILAGLESALLGICLLDRHPNELLGSFLLFSMIFMLFAGLPLCSWRIVIPPKKRDREAGILWTAAREWRVIDLGKLGILVLINGIIGPAVALLLRPDRGTGYQTAFEQPYYVIATVLLTLSLVSMAGFEKVVRPRLGWKWLYAVPRDRRKIAFFFLNSLSFVVLVWLSGLVVSELLF
ncbi:MAG: hypothetical protein MUC63_04120, partial [Planctomycetes bacterium]|nr:hypothetical protein [Planctomycetota bacterium]